MGPKVSKLETSHTQNKSTDAIQEPSTKKKKDTE